MSDPVIIVSCGKRKGPRSARACDLYQGALVRQSLRWARSITLTDRIFILSALYGLVPHDRVIEPYNRRLGDPGSITADLLHDQAERLDLLHRPIVAVAGKDYLTLIRAAWPDDADVIVPFGREAGHRQMFEMMNAMSHHHGRLPT